MFEGFFIKFFDIVSHLRECYNVSINFWGMTFNQENHDEVKNGGKRIIASRDVP